MSPDASSGRGRAGVSVSAALLAIVGILLLFAPDEASRAVMPGARVGPLGQLLGAALLGFAAANWIARGAALGGIYGRAIVAGNQAHVTIGAVILVKAGLEAHGAPPAFWLLAAFYVIAAAFFNYLMFFSSGLRRSSAPM